MEYRNITNVRRLPNEVDAYIISMETPIDGVWESVPYVVRSNGGGLCDVLLEDINAGNYTGVLVDYAETSAATLKRYSKALLFDTMTDAEYATFLQYKVGFTPRQAAIFDNASVLENTSALWGTFEGAITAAYGAERATALLDAAAIGL